MRRIAIIALVPLAFFAATAAFSTDPAGAHFQSTPTDSIDNGGALVVSFDEAGLGNGDINYTLTANATAIYACINNGGHHPSASNKETVAGQVTAGGTFQAKNGRVMASLSTGPLSAGSFSCPSGQSLVLAQVTYSSIVLTDTTNGVTSGVTTDPICRSFSTLFPC